MISLNEYKKQKWVVAVSGGPDSMALLSLCIQEHLDIFVVHINYQKRDTADRDMYVVENYCKSHGVRYETFYYDSDEKGNFQALAREYRYKVFREVVMEKNATGVLVAHHLDDVLETYLMQVNRKSIPSYYGIKKTSYQLGLQIERPLLNFQKVELIAYCDEHGVPYEHDESNASNDYERNKIRHSVVENMSIIDKRELKNKIDAKNIELAKRRKDAVHFLTLWDHSKDDLLKESDVAYILFMWIYKETKERVSHKLIDDIIEVLNNDSPKWEKDIARAYTLSLEYGKLYLYNSSEVAYEYVLSSIEDLETPYFRLLDHGSTIEGITLTSEDFPLTIRSAKHQDEIALRFGTKKLNRWFIDRKIPKAERLLWPVVVNKAGKVIFVPKIGCDVEHYSINPSVFMVKY